MRFRATRRPNNPPLHWTATAERLPWFQWPSARPRPVSGIPLSAMWAKRRQSCGRSIWRYGGLLSAVYIYGDEHLKLRHVVLGCLVRADVPLERVRGHEFPRRRCLVLDDGRRIWIRARGFDAFDNIVNDLNALSTRWRTTGLATVRRSVLAVGAVIATALGWPWFWLWDLL